VTLMAVTPIVFIALRDGWTAQRTVVAGLMCGAASVAAFAATLGVYFVQFGSFNGLYSRMLDRMVTGRLDAGLGEPMSREPFAPFATKLEVLVSYFVNWPPTVFSQFALIIPLTLVFVLVALMPGRLTYWLEHRRNVAQALALTAVFSFLAPLSWHVVATPHSFVHPHMNFVLWYMPFLPFAGATAAVVVAGYLFRRPDFGKPLREVGWAGGIVGAVLLGYVIFATGGDRKPESVFMPAVLAAKSVYRQNDPSLEVRASTTRLYFIADCDSAELQVRFFVHVYPLGSQDMTNRDFSWNEAKLPITFNLEGRRKCVAVRSMDGPVEHVHIGQFVMPAGPRLWETDVRLVTRRILTLAPINDDNWASGIYRHAAGFVLDRTRDAEFLAVQGALISLGGTERRVTRVEVSQQYINVFLDGDVLPPGVEGETLSVEFKF
jgi:hypothetical protein